MFVCQISIDINKSIIFFHWKLCWKIINLSKSKHFFLVTRDYRFEKNWRKFPRISGFIVWLSRKWNFTSFFNFIIIIIMVFMEWSIWNRIESIIKHHIETQKLWNSEINDFQMKIFSFVLFTDSFQILPSLLKIITNLLIKSNWIMSDAKK